MEASVPALLIAFLLISHSSEESCQVARGRVVCGFHSNNGGPSNRVEVRMVEYGESLFVSLCDLGSQSLGWNLCQELPVPAELSYLRCSGLAGVGHCLIIPLIA